MDYGHRIEFGTFITPGNAPATTPVALAQLSESLGYDLVTFQDHPYQAGFLDTWTLMSWVAAQTSTIHISANVLNLPLRPPAVLARAAASLDLLSGGRVELGLGAGGFWDAVDSMGGRKLTPGQGVEALGEAIDVIRGIWDAANRSPLVIDGEYYHLHGAKRGPAPAHEIPIWLGALKPRMLRLIGRKADGWLPSLPYLEGSAYKDGNATIDEAATKAGRDPREIRRLLNIGQLPGSSTDWAEQLLPFAIDDGTSVFIVMGDDPSVMQRFAEEVAPALREAVAAERSVSGIQTGRVRSTIALAKRREGIDYDGLPESLVARAIEPGDSGYSRVKSTYMRGGTPGLVLQVQTTAEIVDALAYARAHPEIALAVRSGGHGISGRSTNDGGIIIDLSKLNAVDVIDEARRLVRVEPGTLWADVAAALQPNGWALSSGDYGGVGVGGLATAGGIGWLVREHGLTIDHVRAVEIVLADGSLVRASADENTDLFWAVRGAGANFGIVVAFEFEVDEVGAVGWAQLAIDAGDTATFLQGWGAVVEAAPRDLTSFLIMGAPRAGQPAVAQVMCMVDSDDPDTIIARLQPIAELGPLLQQSVQIVPYASVMANVQDGDHDGQGQPNSRSGFAEHFTPEFAAAAAAMLESGAVYFFSVRSVGGAVSDIDADATAYGHRSANFSIAALGGNDARLDAAWRILQPHMEGMYLSFETDQSPARLEDAFPPKTLARLRELKLRYDPANVFRDNFNIIQLA
ncbi:MAG: FAD-linked oxidase [Microbacteriaceae bacterium]|nr:FAD-linked oxidase [Microbacteriaceae bacterium]